MSRPRQSMESEIDKRRRIDAQENILILFRKLREGVASSQRNDQFALEVYESSLYLAVIFDSPKQTTSIISALIPEVYLSTPPPHRLCLPTILLSSLHHLLVAYPSQVPFNRFLQSIPETLLPRASPTYAWITFLAASLRTRNYARFERLSRKVSLSEILETPDSISATLGALTITPQANRTLAFKALFTLLDSLRIKSRETSWAIIRSAYRELTCGVQPSETKSWLSRSLCLQSVVSDEFNVEVEDWLAKQVPLGAVRRREDAEGKCFYFYFDGEGTPSHWFNPTQSTASSTAAFLESAVAKVGRIRPYAIGGIKLTKKQPIQYLLLNCSSFPQYQ